MRHLLVACAVLLGAGLASGCGGSGDGSDARLRASGPAVTNQDRLDGDGPAPAAPETAGEDEPGPGAGTGTGTGSTIMPEPPAPPATSPATAGRPDHGVVGRVSDPSGRPVPGAMIQVAPGPGNPAPEREVFATTAADGTYGVGLPAGAWELTVSADGWASRTLAVTVPERGTVTADVVLTPA